METFAIRSDRISATIKANGAELSSLKNADGLELIWQAGPQWPRHAPVLFPIVGRLKHDQLRHRGKVYPMTQHGLRVTAGSHASSMSRLSAVCS